MVKRKSGFTLIELLVVIAIIAILAAILFPIFALFFVKIFDTFEFCIAHSSILSIKDEFDWARAVTFLGRKSGHY